LGKLAFDPYSSVDATREALSCLANALFLKESTRCIFANLQLFGEATKLLKVCSIIVNLDEVGD
jgi:hypothetical protein